MATVPQYNLLYNFTFPNADVQYYSNGLYYYGFSIYNSTSDQIISVNPPRKCSISPQFTSQVVPWCTGTTAIPNDKTILHLYYLNEFLNETIDKIDVGNITTDSLVSFAYSNDYLVFTSFDYISTVHKYSILVYDFKSKKRVCPSAKVNQNQAANTIYTDGKIFVSGAQNSALQTVYTLVNCSTGENFTTNSVNEQINVNLLGFNNSAVFITYYETQNSNYVRTVYIAPTTINSTNNLVFGNSVNISYFIQYNDTHFILAYFPQGEFEFGLYVLTPELEILEVESFNLHVPDDFVIDALPIYGTSWVSINIDPTIIIYDLDARSIIAVDSNIPSITLANGSVVNMTQYGYFIQSPGEPYFFVAAPFSNQINEIYQDPSDFNQFYTLFVPSKSSNFYKKCMMTHFNATSSQITQTIFSNCPLSLPNGNPIMIKDVQFDSNGVPNVVYKDQYGAVYVVNPSGSNGPIKNFYLYTSYEISLNLTNGTLNFVGVQVTSFVIGRVSFITGTVYQMTSFHTGSYITTIFKVNAQYFMLAYSESKSLLDLWDVVNLVRVSSVTSNLFLTFTPLMPAFVLGFNVSAPANYNGILLTDYKDIYLINQAGNTLNATQENSFLIYCLTPISQTQFFASLYQNNLDSEALYEIVNWGTNTTQAGYNNEVSQIEY